MKNFISKLKRKIIHRLGGIVFEDMPIDIAQKLLNHWANTALDNIAMRIFLNGFSTKYVSKKK